MQKPYKITRTETIEYVEFFSAEELIGLGLSAEGLTSTAEFDRLIEEGDDLRWDLDDLLTGENVVASDYSIEVLG